MREPCKLALATPFESSSTFTPILLRSSKNVLIAEPINWGVSAIRLTAAKASPPTPLTILVSGWAGSSLTTFHWEVEITFISGVTPTKFSFTGDCDTTFQVFSYSEMQFVDITAFEVLDVEDTIYSIHCEPYDNFFTENMLVFDAFDAPEE